MTQITEHLLNQALQLAPAEREELVERLYMSLDSSSESEQELNAAWANEIQRRIADADSGNVALVNQEHVHDHIRKLLNREQPAQVPSGSGGRGYRSSSLVS